MAINRAEQEWPSEVLDIFEFEYCHECGGDVEDHLLCEGPFGLPFVMCKFTPLVAGVWFRHGVLIEERAA